MAKSPIDISGVMTAASDQLKLSTATKSGLAVNEAALQSSYDETESRYKQIGTAAALDATVKGMGALQVQEANRRSGYELGADLVDTMGAQRRDADRLLAAQQEQAAALKEIKAKKAVSFFDDPLGYITNQFTVNDDIDKYNLAEAEAASATQAIQQRSQAVEANSMAFKRQQETISTALIDAQAKQALNLAMIQADETNRQGIIANSNNMKELLSLSAQDMQTHVLMVDAKTKQLNLEMAMEARLMARREAAAREKDRARDEQGDMYIIDRLNRGRAIIDPALPKLTLDSPLAINLIKGKIPLDGELRHAYELGALNERPDVNGNQTRLFGYTPVQAVKTLQLRPAMSKDQASAAKFLTNAAKEVEQDPKYKALVTAKDAAGADAYMNAQLKEAFAGQAANAGNPESLYALPSVQDMLKVHPELEQLPFVSKVLKPLIASGQSLASPAPVFAAGLDAVRKGEITLNQFAVDYSAMYRHAQRLNLASKQILNLGVVPEETYKRAIQADNLGWGMETNTIDNANTSAVRRAAGIALGQQEGRLKFGFPGITQKLSDTMTGKDILPNSGFPSFVPTNKGETK